MAFVVSGPRRNAEVTGGQALVFDRKPHGMVEVVGDVAVDILVVLFVRGRGVPVLLGIEDVPALITDDKAEWVDRIVHELSPDAIALGRL